MGFSDWTDEMRGAFADIYKICTTPSKNHPKGAHAYTHFMADFDQIRAICKQHMYATDVKAQDHA